MEDGGYYTGRTTISDVRAAKPKMIYYGANTCWWTHRETDLRRTRPQDFEVGGRRVRGVSLPRDPRGGMLFQTDNVEAFLRAAETEPSHYGKHGLRTFMAAHNDNCVVSESDPRATCFRGWDDYNRLIDEAEARNADHHR